jgi:hypothetical protein
VGLEGYGVSHRGNWTINPATTIRSSGRGLPEQGGLNAAQFYSLLSANPHRCYRGRRFAASEAPASGSENGDRGPK